MAYNTAKLLTMTQTELDHLFKSAEAGPIPYGKAEGTAIVAPGTVFAPEIAKFIVHDYSQTSFVAHWVRDEIRLIGPGLYLGKVFWDKTPLIHFTLQF
jgi:hypothetical protein